jgi:hypothetical protein
VNEWPSGEPLKWPSGTGDLDAARRRWLKFEADLERMYQRKLTEEERHDYYEILCQAMDEVRAAEVDDLETWFQLD